MCHFTFVEALELFISNRSIAVIHRENVGKIKLLPLFISVCSFKSSFRDFTKWNPFETSIRVWKGFNRVSKGEYFFEKNFLGISSSFICCFIWEYILTIGMEKVYFLHKLYQAFKNWKLNRLLIVIIEIPTTVLLTLKYVNRQCNQVCTLY